MRQIRMITRAALAAAGAAALLLAGGAVPATAGSAVRPAPAAAAEITARQAVEIVRGYVPDGRVVRTERVWEQGLWTWWVQVVDGAWKYDFYVSAASGNVVRLKINLNR
ncbi:PepSY domain-containing protein [Planobispora siamensis]|uniref:PepSY domain-containing protein n=1 Tax=Planobispora siamensis TaxID=936338 RepID=A0A8J3SHA4_9ACTN|nr:PepSY domain-containing protein [Planobispora siamensis]GIH92079.1 hypothetical protein Psi01_27090 [Planobispora siamensis]